MARNPPRLSAKPEDILQMADAYDEAAQLTHQLIHFQGQTEGRTVLMMPSLLYVAMAVELYLKCLAQLDKASYLSREHRPWELYCDLEGHTRKQFVVLHHMICADRERSGYLPPPMRGRSYDLGKNLRDAADILRVARYIHEGLPPEAPFSSVGLAEVSITARRLACERLGLNANESASKIVRRVNLVARKLRGDGSAES